MKEDIYTKKMYSDAMIYAARKGHTDTVKLLLEHGADVHAEDDTALLYAADEGHTDTVKVLKEYMEREDAILQADE